MNIYNLTSNSIETSQYSSAAPTHNAINQPISQIAEAALSTTSSLSIATSSSVSSIQPQSQHTTPDEDLALINFYHALPYPLKDEAILQENPAKQENQAKQADEIRTWFTKSASILHCTELDLSFCGLSSIPREIKSFKNLQTLILCRNNFTALPEEIFTGLASLRLLNLNDNQLTALPAGLFAGLTSLQDLHLSNNQLTAIPEGIFAGLTSLQDLHLSNNQLTAIPEGIFAGLTSLQKLNLSGNQLTTTLPEGLFAGLASLLLLNLNDNQLTALPAGLFAGLTSLQKLNLRNNQLTALPAGLFAGLTSLQYLHLSNNQLTAIPEGIFAGLASLRLLDLSGNQLTAIPSSILSLSHNCAVYAERNRFTAQYVQQFQVQISNANAPRIFISIHDHSNNNQPKTLAETLTGWKEEFEANWPASENSEHWTSRSVDFSPFTSLLTSEQEVLKTYLQKLRGIKDYKEPASAEVKKNVILRVEQIIQLACKNGEFLKEIVKLVDEGSRTCGDRVLCIFNEIEIWWQFYHRQLNEAEVRVLAIHEGKYRLLQIHAETIATSNHFGDHVEVILRYHLGLRDRLELPISAQDMLYPAMAKGISEQMLEEAEGIIKRTSDDQLLAASLIWQVHQKSIHNLDVERLTEKYTAALDLAEKYYSTENEARSKFLTTNSAAIDGELHKILTTATDYHAAANLINVARDQAIAKL